MAEVVVEAAVDVAAQESAPAAAAAAAAVLSRAPTYTLQLSSHRLRTGEVAIAKRRADLTVTRPATEARYMYTRTRGQVLPWACTQFNTTTFSLYYPSIQLSGRMRTLHTLSHFSAFWFSVGRPGTLPRPWFVSALRAYVMERLRLHWPVRRRGRVVAGVFCCCQCVVCDFNNLKKQGPEYKT